MSSKRLRHYGVAALASAGSVAVVTAVIALFDQWVPVLSLGVLYIFAVLPVAVVWGLGFALPVSVASMLAFNWFFLPPRHTFTLADSENWFALAVYLATAIVVSELAARARRRASAAEQRERESVLLAGACSRPPARPRSRRRSSPRWPEPPPACWASITSRSSSAAPDAGTRRAPHPLEAAGRQVGTLYTPAGTGSEPRRAPALPAGARGAARGCGRAGAPRARGARGRDAPAERPGQDGAAAGGLARPPLSADRHQAPRSERFATRPSA